MPPSCESQPSRALTATAEEINERIRAYLRARTGRPLHDDEAAEYGRLRDQWCAATRAELVRAA